MKGTLYGIGVGPGDPELMTLKAVRLMNACEVLAWPAPESGPGLAFQIAEPHLQAAQQEHLPLRLPISSPGPVLGTEFAVLGSIAQVTHRLRGLQELVVQERGRSSDSGRR